MSEIDRPRLALYLALGLIICVLGARYLHAQASSPGAGAATAASGRSGAGAAGDGSSAATPAGGAGSAAVAVGRADGGPVVVHVAGAVRRPGVYRLPAGSRVNDALRRAGGSRPGADLTAVNLAAKLEDGRQVLVPLRAASTAAGGGGGAAGGEAPAAGGASSPTAGGLGAAPAPPVNLNTATLEQLDTLDGVGPGIAQRIIDYRAQHGGFRTADELGEVPGIGDKRLAALKPRVTV